MRPAVRAALIVFGAAVVFGAVAAVIATRPLEQTPANPLPGEPGDAFGETFLHFFLGRSPDGSRPRSDTQVLRASTFVAGEEVGLRAQTTPEQPDGVTVELRFLDHATREERGNLQGLRQRFTIQSGLRTYCCVRMPAEKGNYTVAVLVRDRYLTFFPITVKAGPQQTGGLRPTL